jgi:hypothetical protein
MHHRHPHIPIAIGGLLLFLVGCANTSTATKSTATTGTTSGGALCQETPLQTQPYPVPSLADVPWIVADPAASGITGHLFFKHGDEPLHAGGKMPDGAAAKVLWIMTQSSTTGKLVITGRNLVSPPGTYSATFPILGGGQAPSILDIPAAGCWLLTVQDGSVVGTVTFRVVAP